MRSFQSVLVVTASGSMGRVKLGQPVPLSYLSSDEKSGWPDTTSTYRPGSWLFQYSLRNGGSVPSFCVTWYWVSVRRLIASGVLRYSVVTVGSSLCDDAGCGVIEENGCRCCFGPSNLGARRE